MATSSSARPGRKALLSTLAAVLVLALSIQSTRATKVCSPFRPITRDAPSSLAATYALASLPVRGGAAAKVSASAAPASTSTTPSIMLKSFLKTVANARAHLAAAACARAVSIFAMYPVDTIKTRMQIGQGDAFRLKGLYNGVTGSLVGQVPYG